MLWRLQDQHRKDQLMQQRRRDDHAKSNPVTESENGLKFAPIQGGIDFFTVL